MNNDMRFLIKIIMVVLGILVFVVAVFLNMLQYFGYSRWWFAAVLVSASVLTWVQDKYWL